MDAQNYRYPDFGQYVGWKQEIATGEWTILTPDEKQTLQLRIAAAHTIQLGKIRSWLMWLFIGVVALPVLGGFFLVAASSN